MKKSLIFAAMACIAFASCTEDEVFTTNLNQEHEISFGTPYVGKTTRVAQELGATYDTNEKFNVYAVWHNGNFNGWENGSLYMDNVETAYAAAPIDGWKPVGNQYYWPKNGYLTFAAYSPSGAVPAENAHYAADGLTLVGFQVANDNAEHVDLLYSKRSYNNKKANANDANGNTYEDGSTHYKGVEIDFQHALSSIHFTAKLDNAYTGTNITLKKISIYGVYTQADFKEKVNESTPGTYASNPTWINHNAYNQTLPAHSAYVYYESGQLLSDAQWVMKDVRGQTDIIALPQELPTDATIKIEYTIKSPTATSAIAQTNTFAINELTPEWQPGKRYIYNMIFGFDEIYFAPEVIDWSTVNPEPEVSVEDYQ